MLVAFLALSTSFVPSTSFLPSLHHTLSTSHVPHQRAAVKLMPPPLNPIAAGHPLSPPGKPVVIELFLDLICPFSSKMYKTVYDEVLPAFGQQVSFVIHQVPQPWHPQGTYVHEVALAVKQVQPGLYPAVCRALFAAYDSGKFTDADTWNKSRAQVFARSAPSLASRYPLWPDRSLPPLQVYEELLDVAAATGAPRAAVAALLTDTGSGSGMTQSLKWAVKFHRVRSRSMVEGAVLGQPLRLFWPPGSGVAGTGLLSAPRRSS